MEALITEEVKKSVQQIDPEAEIFLFGSRARGDARADSDWDFLILLSQPMTQEVKRAIRDALYEVELETNSVISSLIHYHQDWEDRSVMPIYQTIQVEGILI